MISSADWWRDDPKGYLELKLSCMLCPSFQAMLVASPGSQAWRAVSPHHLPQIREIYLRKSRR
jgi:hypothetical protein